MEIETTTLSTEVESQELKQTLASLTSEFRGSDTSATPPLLQTVVEERASTINTESVTNKKIPLFRFLTNNCCNDYKFDDEFFSELFVKTYNEQYGTEEHQNINKYFSHRNNPNVMKIYDLLGIEKSSKRDENGYLLSSLKVKYFPVELENYMNISIYEGREFVNIYYEKIYREFFQRVIVNIEPVEELRSHYTRLKYVCDKYITGKNQFKDDDIFIIEK